MIGGAIAAGRTMERKQLTDLLAAVQRGACSIDEAMLRLRDLPFEDLDFAKIDHHRALRNGFPEAILGEGKTAEQVIAIAARMAAADVGVLVTRLDPDAAARLVAADVEVARLPVSAACRHALGRRAGAFAATAGEDYELLVAVPPARARLLGRVRDRLGCRLTRIGTVRAGRPEVRLLDASGRRVRLGRSGFDHFR